jgi:hypothetical protein
MQSDPPDHLVAGISRALHAWKSLLIIDGVDDVETLWRGGALNWLLQSGGAGSLGQAQCLVTSRAINQATQLGAHVRCIILTPADNEVVMDKMLARRASGDAQLTLDPDFLVRLCLLRTRCHLGWQSRLAAVCLVLVMLSRLDLFACFSPYHIAATTCIGVRLFCKVSHSLAAGF